MAKVRVTREGSRHGNEEETSTLIELGPLNELTFPQPYKYEVWNVYVPLHSDPEGPYYFWKSFIEPLLKMEKVNGQSRTVIVSYTDSELDRSKVPPEQRKAQGGGCFIATATYGSPLAPQVTILRQFRDEVLLNSKSGVWLTKLYYLVSPPIARLISRTYILRVVTRGILTPLLWLLKKNPH